MWIAERQEVKLPIAKRTKFSSLFHEKFNLGFGQPKLDVCSKCKLLTAELKRGTQEEHAEAETRLKLHTLCWQKFSRILKESRDICDTVTVVFDL